MVLEQRFAQRLLHLARAGSGVLPAIEANQADDLVDVLDDAFHGNGRVLITRLLEQFREGGLPAILVFLRRHIALGLQQIASQVEQLLEELNAVQLALLVLLFQGFQPLGQLAEARVPHVPAQTLRHLDLDLLGLALRVRGPQHGFEYLRVQHYLL